jgi:hypothetical protein
MAKKNWASSFFKLSRLTRDAEVIASGSPSKMARRVKNKWLGRNVIRKIYR